MNTIGKLIVASVAVVSFAAPALATDYNSDAFILQERGQLNAQQSYAPTQSRDWSNAYAQDQRATRAYASDRGYEADGSSTAGRGADAVNGGN